MARNVRMRLALCWAWIAIVATYSLWAAVNYAGLFRWAADFQIEKWDGYSEKWTAILPGMILASPALWYIGRRGAIDRAAARPAPNSEAQRLKRTSLFFGVVGVLAVATAAASYLFSLTIPDSVERPVPFDASRLAMAPAPKGEVLIRGEAVPGAQAAVPSGGMLAEATVYAGFRPARDRARSGPIRLFIERRLNDRRDIATDQFFLDEQEGYLVENGVPGGVLEKFRRRGIVVASPHYLLRERALGARDPYYIVAGVGGFFGLMFLAVAGAVAAQPRRRPS